MPTLSIFQLYHVILLSTSFTIIPKFTYTFHFLSLNHLEKYNFEVLNNFFVLKACNWSFLTSFENFYFPYIRSLSKHWLYCIKNSELFCPVTLHHN